MGCHRTVRRVAKPWRNQGEIDNKCHVHCNIIGIYTSNSDWDCSKKKIIRNSVLFCIGSIGLQWQRRVQIRSKHGRIELVQGDRLASGWQVSAYTCRSRWSDIVERWSDLEFQRRAIRQMSHQADYNQKYDAGNRKKNLNTSLLLSSNLPFDWLFLCLLGQNKIFHWTCIVNTGIRLLFWVFANFWCLGTEWKAENIGMYASDGIIFTKFTKYVWCFQGHLQAEFGISGHLGLLWRV